MHTQKRVGSSSCSGDTFLFLTLDSRREMRGRLCTHTTMVVGGYMDGTTKNWRDVSCHATQFKVNRRGINFLPGFLFLVCFVFLLSIQFSAYCRGRCRPLNISMDDAKNGPVNFRLTELWRRARLYTIFIRIFLPRVCLVRVSRVCDGWIDLIIHGCYKGMCVCIQQREASHISPSSEGLGLETAALHTHRHQLFDCMKTAGSHACRNALHMLCTGSFLFFLFFHPGSFLLLRSCGCCWLLVRNLWRLIYESAAPL